MSQKLCSYCDNEETDDDILIPHPGDVWACHDCHNDCAHHEVEDLICLVCGRVLGEYY